MNYLLVGLNHKTAPVKLREKVALDASRTSLFLKSASKLPGVREVVVLSTCNRVEVYAFTENPDESAGFLTRELFGDEIGQDIQTCVYKHVGNSAVHHLFEVTSSLDSQVVGENQITSQVKDAFDKACVLGTSGTFLNKLFSQALHVSKRVRSETEIGRGQVSMSSVAVTLARKIFGSLHNRRVVLIGAGEMGELCVRSLKAGEVGDVCIVNRTFERAQEIEKQGLGVAYPYSDLKRLLQTADVVITSVSAPIPELSPEAVSVLMRERLQESLFIIDLGMPRNVVEETGKLDDVYLYNLDDLKTVTDKGREGRHVEAQRARELIETEVASFCSDMHSMPDEIARLAEKFEALRNRELTRTLNRLSHLSDEDRLHIERLSKSLISKILLDPIVALRADAASGEPTLREVVRRIFRLDDEG